MIEELYSFTWPGKGEALKESLSPSTGVLCPCQEESVSWNTTKNIFIEGDNIDALKLLQKDYAGKVRMIYIDPPYNTGNNHLYRDRFADSKGDYIKYTGQKGLKKPEVYGRFHANWLNLMYPRLMLAKDLLKSDGIIFISIDDHEAMNLRKLCDEIFGEENFVVQLIWKRRTSSGTAKNNVSVDHEYVLCYQRESCKFIGFRKDYKRYSNTDNDPRGAWKVENLTVGMNASMRPNQAYDLIDPETGITYPHNPNCVWKYIPKTMDKKISEGKIIFPKDPSWRPREKRFKSELRSDHNPISSLMLKIVGLNGEGTRMVQKLMGGKVFDHPKPVSLLETLISQLSLSTNDIVLDFFAGSCTTAHAVLNMSKGCKFIMVQSSEPCNEKSLAFKAGYSTIAEIGKERIRRVIKSKDPECKNDLGFKVFKIGEQ